MKFALFSILLLFTTACASTRKPAQIAEPVVIVGEEDIVQLKTPKKKAIDMAALRENLRMISTELGFYERSFNTCSLPVDQRPSTKCETRYFSLINFQMVCRDSEGTVESVSEYNMTPMSSRPVTYLLSGVRGQTYTDGEGSGSVMTVTKGSTARKSLVLKSETHALGLSAKEVRRIVVPLNWCQ